MIEPFFLYGIHKVFRSTHSKDKFGPDLDCGNTHYSEDNSKDNLLYL